MTCAEMRGSVGNSGNPKRTAEIRPFWYSTIVYLAQEPAKYIWQIVYSLVKMNGHILNVQSESN